MLPEIVEAEPSRAYRALSSSTVAILVAVAITLGMQLGVQLAAQPALSATTTEDQTENTDGEEPADGSTGGSADESEQVSEGDAALEEQLREGQQVYSQICSSCHQPGGAGLAGQYPPLIDNPRVDDGDYVREVIENGLRGELEVGGEIYNGVMPSFSTLSDEESDAVIAYIQADFVAPAGEAAIGPTGPVAGTELPALTSLGAILAYLLTAGVAALVLAPRVLSVNSRLNTPWLDAWLKTAVIVTAVVFLTVVIPDWALKLGPVTKLSRFAQDLIGTGLWLGGLSVLLLGLWYAHRESRI